ncbi:MAG: hypothetical protein KDA22_02030 [Phycisphaerales bacterium]|nr:hypothetical protein [Phycisphaerales bacterium]
MTRTSTRRALTMGELLVCTAVVAILAAALVPVSRSLRDCSGTATSMAKLNTLSFAHALYGWDWDDRQVTWIPDDAGTVNGGCSQYVSSIGCPPQLLLGWDEGYVVWGYFLGQGQCSGYPGSCANWVTYQPITFSTSQAGFGSFRLANAKAFHDYVNGRFYDEAFYLEEDTLTWQGAEPYFDLAAEFTSFGSEISNSSFCLSPAAMWHPDVLSLNPDTGLWWKDPTTFAEAYASPTVSQATYPDLKTRMIEHNWVCDPPAESNPAFTGNNTPYFFNSGLDVVPVAMFFDGHVDLLPNTEVAADDQKVLGATGGAVGLWTRDTPFGVAGYYGEQSYDGLFLSHHVLTAGGITGRDRLGDTAPAQGAANGRRRHGPKRATPSSAWPGTAQPAPEAPMPRWWTP